MKTAACHRALLLVLGLLACVAARAADPGMEVTVSRERVYQGESFILSVKVTDAERRGEPDLSQLRHCQIRPLGSQDISNYSIVIVNGRMQREGFSGRVYQYEVTPQDTGAFETGPITLQAGGKGLAARGPTVTVTGITRQDLVRISVTASRSAVLVDESFDITLNLRIRRLPGRYAQTEPIFPGKPPVLTVPYLNGEVEGLRGPDIGQLLRSKLASRGQPGLAINSFTVRNSPFDFGSFFNMDNPFGEQAAVFTLDKQGVDDNGVPYLSYTLTLTYSPVAEGTYTFGPVVFKGEVPVEVDANGQASSTEIFAVGPAATVRVIPPPEDNRPESYVGAIGSNLVVQAALDAQTCNVGDPLTLTLTLDGPVQMRNVFPPHLSLQTNLIDRFEVYDDAVKTLKRDPARVYAYTLRPRTAGSMELPPLAVSYYDVGTRGYHTVYSQPIPLKVRQATEITASQIIGNVTGPVARAGTSAATDLAPAGMRMDPHGAEPRTLWGPGPVMAALLGTGPLAFLLTLTAVTLRRTAAARRQSRLARSARSRAERALRRLGTASPPDGHAQACTILRQFISDRLAIPAAAMTPADAAARLCDAGLRPELANRFRTCMDRHVHGAYGSTGDTRLAGDAIDEAIRLLHDVDAQLPPRAATPAAARILPWLLLAGVAGFSRTAGALAADEAAFLWDDANTMLTSARTPADFQNAAAQYQKLVEAGVRNAPLFYNQGTALLQAGRYDDALRVLSRAERYEGHSTDTTRNLQVARARKAGLKARVALWDRGVLFWHYELPASTRMQVAALAFSLAWIALALRVIGRRTAGRRTLALALGLLVLFGSSAVTTLVQEQSARPPVFTPGTP